MLWGQEPVRLELFVVLGIPLYLIELSLFQALLQHFYSIQFGAFLKKGNISL